MPSQDIGIEYFATLFDLAFEAIVPVFGPERATSRLPATTTARLVAFDVPLDVLGGDDGFIDPPWSSAVRSLRTGRPTWATARSTIRGRSRGSARPRPSGAIAAGGFQDVVITLGSAVLAPGEYHGSIVFVTDAPKQTRSP